MVKKQPVAPEAPTHRTSMRLGLDIGDVAEMLLTRKNMNKNSFFSKWIVSSSYEFGLFYLRKVKYIYVPNKSHIWYTLTVNIFYIWKPFLIWILITIINIFSISTVITMLKIAIKTQALMLLDWYFNSPIYSKHKFWRITNQKYIIFINYLIKIINFLLSASLIFNSVKTKIPIKEQTL